MPFFDFECKKCGEVKSELIKYSEDMHKHIDKCECGAKSYKRLMTVSWGYKQDLTTGHEERREADKMAQKDVANVANVPKP
jgi:putative FmdB family regulatory protein|tara:strand:- start:9915 stop:10157 length:243 start_codon:yes stop_codon:yes gene_type:complete